MTRLDRIASSFAYRTLIAASVVLFFELAFRLYPIVQVTAVNSPAFDVNLKRSLTNFCQGWAVLAFFFCDLRPANHAWCVLIVRFQILRFHASFLPYNVFLVSTAALWVTKLRFKKMRFPLTCPPFRRPSHFSLAPSSLLLLFFSRSSRSACSHSSRYSSKS